MPPQHVERLAMHRARIDFARAVIERELGQKLHMASATDADKVIEKAVERS